NGRRPSSLKRGHRVGAILGRPQQMGEGLKYRLRVDAANGNRILPSHAARLRDTLLHLYDAGDDAEHLLEARLLDGGLRVADECRQQIAYIRGGGAPPELRDDIGRPRREWGAPARRPRRGW